MSKVFEAVGYVMATVIGLAVYVFGWVKLSNMIEEKLC